MEIIKELIEKPFELVWNTLTAETKQIVSNRILEYELEEYERNYYTKTIINRTEPIKLKDFYQPLFLLVPSLFLLDKNWVRLNLV